MLSIRTPFSVVLMALLIIANGSYLQAASPFPLLNTINNPEPANNGLFGGSLGSFNGNLLVGAPGNLGSAYLIDLNNKSMLTKFTSPDYGKGSISFGNALVQVGQSVAIGDLQADVGATARAGSVYLFNGTTGQNLLTIRDPNTRVFGEFGDALQTFNGNLLINSGSASTSQRGTVYVFNPTNGQLLNTINNPDDASVTSYEFGFDMQVRQGSLFIAAPGASVSGVNAGAVYRYDGPTLTQSLRIPSPILEAGDSFGDSIATGDAGLLVGASRQDVGGKTDVGQAYLFNATTGALLQTFANPAPQDFVYFGSSVTLVGHYAVVGCIDTPTNPLFSSTNGAAFVFDVNTGAYVGRIDDPNGSGREFTLAYDSPHGVYSIGNVLLAPGMRDDVGPFSSAGVVYSYAVPEPSSFALAALGSLTLLYLGRPRMR